jgi:hypothetical protein
MSVKGAICAPARVGFGGGQVSVDTLTSLRCWFAPEGFRLSASEEVKPSSDGLISAAGFGPPGQPKDARRWTTLPDADPDADPGAAFVDCPSQWAAQASISGRRRSWADPRL